MNESVLRALLRLFALVTEAPDDQAIALSKNQVQAYLQHKISARQLKVYLAEFEEYLLLFSRSSSASNEKKARKASSLGSVKVIMICEKINENLSQQEKVTVLIRLIEFVHKGGQISFRETNFLETLAKIFNISDDVYELIQHFVLKADTSHEKLIRIGAEKSAGYWIERPQLEGYVLALLLPGSSTVYVKYIGNKALSINDHPFEPHTVYLLNEGGTIVGQEMAPLHHNEVLRTYFSEQFEKDIRFEAADVSFRFPNGTVGLHPISISEQSGCMMGIMGASGAGKSTLLNVLNGVFPPAGGSVTINGLPAHSKAAKQLIGYVPQDDLLVEELTVFENLYYSGLLCLPGLSTADLTGRIHGLLKRIDLYEARNLRVGSVLDKRISGGQRKRLNIALELLREPTVLFVDEPTSGLSSQDSEVVMKLLKQLTYKGKLIFVVIHQPSSFIYKLLDKLLLLDKGGYPVYQGHAMEAPAWFREQAGYVEEPGEEGLTAAQIDPDEMLRILEARHVDEYGEYTAERIRTPEEWYELYRSELDPTTKSAAATQSPEQYHYAVPSGWRQFTVHLKRNVLSKVRNTSFMLLALLEAPVLAFIIGYFTRFAIGTESDPSAYIFYFNKNFPAFLFMIIVVAIFVGMQISAEEIIRDRKILRRESFLNLSKLSYLNSKVLYLLILSAIQAALLVITGNLLLEVKGMNLYFFAVLFPTFVFANLVGLNVSAAFKSVVTIYVLIPFLVVPQLLLSGVIVDFDTLQVPEEQGRKTPVVADLMVARWAYEAMAVGQFKRNEYERHFFKDDLEKHEALYQFSYRLPKLQTVNRQCLKWTKDEAKTKERNMKLGLLRKEVAETNQWFRLKFAQVDDLHPDRFTQLTSDLLDAWLSEIERQYRKVWEAADDRIRATRQQVAERRGLDKDLESLKHNHHNQKLEEHLKNSYELQKIRVVDDVLVNKSDYIFKRPEQGYSRAHFYAPYKLWFGQKVDTLWFNIFVIWGFNLLLYLTLYYNVLGRLLKIKWRAI